MLIIILAPLAPHNFSVMVTSSTTVMTSWQRPSVTNGILSHYTLYYYTEDMEYSITVTYNGEMVRIHRRTIALMVM